MRNKNCSAVLALAAALCVTSALADADVASLASNGVGFAAAAPYDRAKITLSGPQGVVYRRPVAAGAPLFIASRGLPDGTYRYQLVLDSDDAISGPAVGVAAPPRSKPVRTVSGEFTVAGGAVVDPASRSPQR